MGELPVPSGHRIVAFNFQIVDGDRDRQVLTLAVQLEGHLLEVCEDRREVVAIYKFMLRLHGGTFPPLPLSVSSTGKETEVADAECLYRCRCFSATNRRPKSAPIMPHPFLLALP